MKNKQILLMQFKFYDQHLHRLQHLLSNSWCTPCLDLVEDEDLDSVSPFCHITLSLHQLLRTCLTVLYQLSYLHSLISMWNVTSAFKAGHPYSFTVYLNHQLRRFNAKAGTKYLQSLLLNVDATEMESPYKETEPPWQGGSVSLSSSPQGPPWQGGPCGELSPF